MISITKATIEDVDYFFKTLTKIKNVRTTREHFVEMFKRILKANESFTYIFEDENKDKLGFVYYKISSHLDEVFPILTIDEIFVENSSQKSIISDVIFKFLEDTARKNKVFKMIVAFKDDSIASKRFYLQRGFEADKKIFGKSIF